MSGMSYTGNFSAQWYQEASFAVCDKAAHIHGGIARLVAASHRTEREYRYVHQERETCEAEWHMPPDFRSLGNLFLYFVWWFGAFASLDENAYSASFISTTVQYRKMRAPWPGDIDRAPMPRVYSTLTYTLLCAFTSWRNVDIQWYRHILTSTSNASVPEVRIYASSPLYSVTMHDLPGLTDSWVSRFLWKIIVSRGFATVSRNFCPNL